MIIKRKYELFGIIYKEDSKSRQIIDEAFALDSTITDGIKAELIQGNHELIPAYADMGCGIPSKCYQYIMDGFEKLDKLYPYDNGLTFNDVTKIEYETSRKGNAIQMKFVCDHIPFAEYSYYRIVGFAALENKNGIIGTNKGWEMC